MELVDGIYAYPQTIEQRGAAHTIHPAAVRTEKGLLLIDAGYDRAIEQLEANLDDSGFEFTDVRGIILTHQDGDHASAAASVVDRTGATVFAHERAAPYIDGREQPIKVPRGDRYPPCDVDVELVDGVTFGTVAGRLEVVYTPGHAPGHISLYLPDDELLIAADALTADAGDLAGPSEQFTLEMAEALDSAERLATLNIEKILCYHGGLVEAGSSDIRAVVDARR